MLNTLEAQIKESETKLTDVNTVTAFVNRATVAGTSIHLKCCRVRSVGFAHIPIRTK